MHPSPSPGSILVVGASRGLGLAVADEFVKKGWNVIGTVRGSASTALHELSDAYPGRIDIESLDVNDILQIESLRERLGSRTFEILFHNAGVANANFREAIDEVSTDEFAHVMVTNALGPLRVIEAFQDLVRTDGLIGVMSSGQGSIGNNERGGADVYRASKAALNQLMRCYAARHVGDRRALVLMAPGWIRTALGGPDATFSIEETIPKVVDVLLSQRGTPGLRFLDREGAVVPW